jgi:hypothetical protein
MAYFEDGSEAMLRLEAMVNKAGLRNVLWALAHISRAKAHLEGNLQTRTPPRPGCATRSRSVARSTFRRIVIGGKSV